MAKPTMTRRQVRDKVEWEGGVVSTLNYGLRAEDIEDPKLASLWSEAQQIQSELSSVVAEINQSLRAA